MPVDMIHRDYMWCRWCGDFGMPDLMVCAKSECMAQDMLAGELADAEWSGTTISGSSPTVTAIKAEHSGIVILS